MKKLMFLVVLLSSISLFSQNNFQEVKAGHIFSIKVPFYLIKTYNINPGAVVQYWNEKESIYLLVAEEEKEKLNFSKLYNTSIREYAEGVLNNFQNAFSDFKVISQSNYESNGNKLIQYEISGSINGENGNKSEIIMILDVVESPTYFYQVTSWTLASNMDNYKADLKSVAKTLKD